MIFKFPIDDRSEADLLEYKTLATKGWVNMSEEERTKWLDGMKCALNLKDLQRVLNNIEYINKAMGLGLTVSTKTDFLLDTRIFEEIKYNLEHEYKQAPSLPYNTYEKWNEIERILKDCYSLLTKDAIKIKGETAYRLGFRVGSMKGVLKI